MFHRLHRTILAAALGALCLSGPAAAFTEQEKEDMGDVIRAYLLENPEVITEAMTVLEARAAAEEENRRKAAIASSGPVIDQMAAITGIGNANGDITVVEFFDYNCGWCKRSLQPVLDAVNTDGNTRLVLMEYPVLRESSLTAARAALAAAKQGKYRDFHLALMAEKSALTDDSIMTVASNVGLDVTRLKKDMDAPEILKTLTDVRKIAEDLGVTGTPAFLIGTQFRPGAFRTGSEVLDAINAARSDQTG